MIWFILIGACALLIVIALVCLWNTSEGNFGEVTTGVIGVISIGVAACLVIFTVIVGCNALGTTNRAKLLNEAYGTHYTPDDLFWGDDIIKEVIQGKRSRIDLNMTGEKP